jgi:nitrous oxide reductase accessory protein NosL
MKKMLAAIAATLLVTSMAFTALAADPITIKGDAMCTKCAMHETDKCGCAIKTADGTVYYADKNDVAKDFHETICKANAKVVATGTVEDKDGKKVITLSKIEVAKDAK